jgi:hypothetical protein
MDFTDLASRYLQTRMDTAMQPFTDPNAYMSRRLGINQEPDIEANVKPVTQTITTDPVTGEQMMTVKGRPEDLSAANPNTPTVTPAGITPPQPRFTFGAPQIQPEPNIQPPAPVAPPPVQQAPVQQAPVQQAPAPVAPPAAPMPVNMPLNQPPAGMTPGARPIISDTGQILGNETPQQMVQGAQTNAPVAPAPIPAPQAAPVPQMTPTAAPQAAPAPAPVEQPLEVWQQDLLDAQKDKTKLHAYIANKNNPQEGKDIAETLLKQQYKRDEEDAKMQKSVEGFVRGDKKAVSDVTRAIQSRSEEGNLLKAYLYSRFGLNELARQEQLKLGGSNFNRMMLDGKNYMVEETPMGGIKAAYDSKGKAVDETTLAALNAGAMKTGTHAFGFTGESAIVPSGQKGAGEEVRQRTNAMTGGVDYVYVTGPQAGEIYRGSTPIAKSVQTAGQKAELTSSIQAAWAGPTAANRASGAYAGEFNAKNGANIGIRSYGGQQYYVDRNNNDAPVVPDRNGKVNFVPNAATTGGAQTTATAPGAPSAPSAPTTAPSVLKTPPAPVFREAGYENESPANYESRTNAWKQDVEKTSAAAGEARGEIQASKIANQNEANKVYKLIQPISDLVKQSTGSGVGAAVDTIASKFGVGTEGGKAIAELNQYSAALRRYVPRFKGSDSDRDVKLYEQMAGQFNDASQPVAYRLAALKGMIRLLEQKDEDKSNDWSFGSAGNTGIKIIKREKIQ